MVAAMTDLTPLKRAAAAKALEYVVDGMKLGLGSGSTAELFVELLAPRVRGGQKLLCVPTSERTATLARKLGLTLSSLDDQAPLDLTVDGADEADRNLDLIKGGGGMLLREKIVAASSKKMIVIADESKLVPRLGKFPLPVEVVEFGHKAIAARLQTVAPAGGIAMTEKVAELVGPSLHLPLEDLGVQQFRNMCLPIRVFQCRVPGESDS